LNSKLWSTGTEANKNTVRKQKRKETYVCNIVVVDDPAHPENNGKTFLYNFGKKIMEKIQDKLPKVQKAGAKVFEDPDEVKFNAFNLWEGANFKLKVRKVDNFPNYDKSEFLTPGPLFTDDKKMEAAWRAGHSLVAEVAPDKFKSYEELRERLNQVLGLEDATEMPRAQQVAQPAAEDEVEAATTPTEQEDDDFAVFQRMAQAAK
jgi:hypothetical protein